MRTGGGGGGGGGRGGLGQNEDVLKKSQFDINRNYIVQLYCDTDNGNFMNNYILYVLGTIIIIC